MHQRTFNGLLIMAATFAIALPAAVGCCYCKKSCGFNQPPVKQTDELSNFGQINVKTQKHISRNNKISAEYSTGTQRYIPDESMINERHDTNSSQVNLLKTTEPRQRIIS